MEIKKIHFIGIAFALIIILGSLIFLRSEKIFPFLMVLAALIGVFPFMFSVIMESEKETENNQMFLEFSRNLVESVKAGTPISKSIINLKDKYYGSLSKHIQKLGNQISIGIPVKEALSIFARNVNSPMVSRAVMLISEAEIAGGNIEDVLESVARSVSEIEKLKKERKATIYTLVVQGYIIFLVFIVIMLVMQFKILPMTAEISQFKGDIGGFGAGKGFSAEEFSKPLLYLLILQGFFSGLIIGKLSEGKVKAGIKHSFILLALSLLAYTGAQAFF